MIHIKYFEYFKSKVDYEFSIDGDNFLVEFLSVKNEWNLSYYSWDSKINNWSVSRLVNSNPHKILDKVFGEILNIFIKEYQPKVIMIDGLSKDLEKSFISQRTRIYLRYLTRNVPDGYVINPSSIENITSNRISISKL